MFPTIARSPRLQVRERGRGGRAASASNASCRYASFGLVEGDAEAEQRQAHFDRFLVGVLHGDFEVAAGSHGGDELVGERHEIGRASCRERVESSVVAWLVR